jgi:hypothetical protein
VINWALAEISFCVTYLHFLRMLIALCKNLSGGGNNPFVVAGVELSCDDFERFRIFLELLLVICSGLYKFLEMGE